MTSTLCRTLVNQFLSSYLESLDDKAILIGLWRGSVELTNVALRRECLTGLGVPIIVEEGTVRSLSISIPWRHLGSRPVTVTLDGVHLAVRPHKLDQPPDGGGRRRRGKGRAGGVGGAEAAAASAATDNAATQQDLSAQLRFADGTSRMRVLPSIGQQARLRHTSVEAAVVDIFTAAQARVFKGTYRSSFSDAILHLRRCTGRTHPDDEHSISTEEGAKQQTYLHSLLPPGRRYLGVFF